jgi:hypothetical protein
MKSEKSTFKELLSWAAIAGNLIFILWILYNGINEGFQGTLPEKISYIGLLGLLALNAILILSDRIWRTK